MQTFDVASLYNQASMVFLIEEFLVGFTMPRRTIYDHIGCKYDAYMKRHYRIYVGLKLDARGKTRIENRQWTELWENPC